MARLACYEKGLSCTSIESDLDRVDCFDALYGLATDEDGIETGGSRRDELPSATPPDPDNFGRKARQLPMPKEIRTEIVGEFSGWSKGDRFELANGQVWEYRKSDTRRVRTHMNPKVTITRNLFGLYSMKVEPPGVTVPVRRVD